MLVRPSFPSEAGFAAIGAENIVMCDGHVLYLDSTVVSVNSWAIRTELSLNIPGRCRSGPRRTRRRYCEDKRRRTWLRLREGVWRPWPRLGAPSERQAEWPQCCSHRAPRSVRRLGPHKGCLVRNPPQPAGNPGPKPRLAGTEGKDLRTTSMLIQFGPFPIGASYIQTISLSTNGRASHAVFSCKQECPGER